ncbi:kxDL motif-containing protein 1 isoform X1 [Petromyzon marinus]|uniref:KxDL motif-containing protein 1 n=2 Tax=Petromyzon marinus TaxID=7757 RepID=A0AAJ7T0G2_PETMA|nr:kxDL motif-containing protein 1 isoform X1 [Petromyzon marinus]
MRKLYNVFCLLYCFYSRKVTVEQAAARTTKQDPGDHPLYDFLCSWRDRHLALELVSTGPLESGDGAEGSGWGARAVGVMEGSAPDYVTAQLLGMVNQDDISAVVQAQRHMLDRFEKTNEMLLNFNELSSSRLASMTERFTQHTRTLADMRRDLDTVFRRIRTLRRKLEKQYPESFSRCHEAGAEEEREGRREAARGAAPSAGGARPPPPGPP